MKVLGGSPEKKTVDFLYIMVYTLSKGCDIMETAKIFENGRSQAVRLPKKYRFSVDEVVVQRIGSSLMLTPKEKVIDNFLDSLDEFTDDFMEDGRYFGTQDERESL